MGYQQGGPPQGYQPQPAPAQPPQAIDFQAMLKNFSTGDLVIGGALILMFIFSFIGGFKHVSVDNCGAGLGVSISSASCSATGDSLWGGLGILAALLILVAIAFYVVRKLPQIQLPLLPLPDWQIWTIFGVFEAVLIFLSWLVGKSSSGGVDFGSLPGISTSPGWSCYVLIILALAVAVGGYLKQNDPVSVSTAPTPTGGYGAYTGYQQQPPSYGAPQQPYADPSQQQPPAYGAPQQPYGDPSQQQGYPPQQPPTGYPPQQ